MGFKFIFSFLLLINFMSNSWAQSFLISKITSDLDDEVVHLSLVLDDDGNATSLLRETFLNSRLLRKKSYSISPLNSQGIVLYEVKNRDVITIKGNNVDFNYGGEVKLSYLFNGMTGRTRYVKLQFHLEDGVWHLLYNNKPVESMHINCRTKPFVGVIGIKSIDIYNFDGKRI